MSSQQPGPAPRFELREPRPGCLALAVAGEIDASTAAEFEAQLLGALERAAGPLVVDLKEVDFFDSAGIRSLVALRQRAGANHGRLYLVLPGRSGVRRALELVAIQRLFQVVESADQAIDPAGAELETASGS